MKYTIKTSGERLDIYLTGKLKNSRSHIKKLIDEGHITVNENPVKAGYVLKEKDIVIVNIPEEKNELKAIKIPLDIIFEDEHIIVLNKPINLVVHPGAGTTEPTLVHALLAHTQHLAQLGRHNRPGIVHRLDKDTSGVMVVAKTDKAYSSLVTQFKKRTIKKTYLALVEGYLKNKEDEITLPIGRHPTQRTKMKAFKTLEENGQAREAHTKYKVLKEHENKSLIQVQILTGRTHQIRVHMQAIGHSVVGDPTYGHKGSKQLLFAHTISFKHPITEKQLTFSAPPPKWANY